MCKCVYANVCWREDACLPVCLEGMFACVRACTCTCVFVAKKGSWQTVSAKSSLQSAPPQAGPPHTGPYSQQTRPDTIMPVHNVCQCLPDCARVSAQRHALGVGWAERRVHAKPCPPPVWDLEQGLTLPPRGPIYTHVLYACTQPHTQSHEHAPVGRLFGIWKKDPSLDIFRVRFGGDALHTITYGSSIRTQTHTSYHLLLGIWKRSFPSAGLSSG